MSTMSERHIISASRRTDIPHYFAPWLENRIRAGRAEFRNAFGGWGAASLKPEDVAAWLFWTKYCSTPFHRLLRVLLAEGVPCAFQYTITGLGGTDYEPNIPKLARVIADFLALRGQLPDGAAIEWRYDPILLSDELNEHVHRSRFSAIAAALQGAAKVVNTSFVEPYLKTVRRLRDHPTLQFRTLDVKRHKSTAARHPDLSTVEGERARRLLAELSRIAAHYGFELRSCANPEFTLPASQCIGAELFVGYGKEVVSHLGVSPSRTGCRCLKSFDIGMDNTCIGGCKYCYVVVSHETSLRNFRNHDPLGKMLR